MKRADVMLIAGLVGVLSAFASGRMACPPKLEIGQTYNQIKAGPCPDIETQAFDRKGTVVSYYCPSLKTAVLGSVVTGKMIGFVLIEFNPHE